MTDGIVKVLKVGATVLACGVSLILEETIRRGAENAIYDVADEATNAYNTYMFEDVEIKGRFGKKKMGRRNKITGKIEY